MDLSPEEAKVVYEQLYPALERNKKELIDKIIGLSGGIESSGDLLESAKKLQLSKSQHRELIMGEYQGSSISLEKRDGNYSGRIDNFGLSQEEARMVYEKLHGLIESRTEALSEK